MPSTNIKQAEIPQGATKLITLKEHHQDLHRTQTSGNIFLFSLAHLREFIPLVTDELVPFLKNNFDNRQKRL